MENRILNRPTFSLTWGGNFACSSVAIAQIHPKIPMIKNNIMTGNSLNNKSGLVTVKKFMMMGTPQVIRNNCQCLMRNKNLIYEGKVSKSVRINCQLSLQPYKPL